MAAGTFIVAGRKVRTSSQRRFVAWMVTDRGESIFARSDSMATIQTRISRKGWSRGVRYVVIDTKTGEQVANI